MCLGLVKSNYRRKNQNRGAFKKSCIWDRTINLGLNKPECLPLNNKCDFEKPACGIEP